MKSKKATKFYFPFLLLIIGVTCRQDRAANLVQAHDDSYQEVPIGVRDLPFRAAVVVNWTSQGGGGVTAREEAHGSLWRDKSGNVRLEGMRTTSGSNGSNLPTLTKVILPNAKTELFWNSTAPIAKSIHFDAYPSSFFEGLVVPSTFETPRSPLYRCDKTGIECKVTSLGSRMIDGLAVDGTQYKKTISGALLGIAGKCTVTREVWIYPKLDIIVLIEDSDSTNGTFSMRLSGITGGQQNDELFRLPDGYKLSAITALPPGGLRGPHPPEVH